MLSLVVNTHTADCDKELKTAVQKQRFLCHPLNAPSSMMATELATSVTVVKTTIDFSMVLQVEYSQLTMQDNDGSLGCRLNVRAHALKVKTHCFWVKVSAVIAQISFL